MTKSKKQVYLRPISGRLCTVPFLKKGKQINDVFWEEVEKKMYSNGIRVTKTTVSTVPAPVAAVAVEEEAVSITELSSEQNRDLLESVLRGNSEGARIFRVEKYSDGFSALEVIPGFSMAEEVHIVNRCRQVSRGNSSFPVSLDFLDRGLPWFHMCAGGAGSIIDVPRSERSLVRITPPIEILHRSALLDSFHAKGEAKERMSITVDVIIR